MKLLKKLVLSSMIIGLSITGLGATKSHISKSVSSSPKDSYQNFTLRMSTARKLLELKQPTQANKFEKYLVSSIVNLNQARLMAAMEESAPKTSESLTLKPLPENTSNPAFMHYYNIAKRVWQATEDKKGRIFWRKLLRINKVFDKKTLRENSLADLIDVERLYPSREIFVRTKKDCGCNYCYVPKIFALPVEDDSTAEGFSNLRKLIISLSEDYGVISIVIPSGLVHITGINTELDLCKVETGNGEEIWSLDTLEKMCRARGSLYVYYLEKRVK